MDNYTKTSNTEEDSLEAINKDDVKMRISTIKDLPITPLTITVEQLGEIMGIGRVSAYNLAHQKGFPLKKVGRRIIIPYQAFHKWLNK